MSQELDGLAGIFGIPNISEVLGVPITSIAGPLFICVILNWGLFGVLSTQVLIYHQAFPKDKLHLKALIYFVYAIETVQTVLFTQTAWQTYVSGYGNIFVFDTIGTTWFSGVFVGGLVAFLVQSLYAYRIWILSQSKLLTGSIMIVALTSFAGSLATSIIVGQTRLFSDVLSSRSRSFPAFSIWHSAGSTCDVIIAICMTYHLKRLLRGGGVMRTQQAVSKVIALVVETGTLTATVSLVSMALFFTSSGHAYFQVPLVSLAKLYSNTLLVVVNNRIKYSVASDAITWKDVEFFQNVDRPKSKGYAMSKARPVSYVGSLRFAGVGETTTIGDDFNQIKTVDITAHRTEQSTSTV